MKKTTAGSILVTLILGAYIFFVVFGLIALLRGGYLLESARKGNIGGVRLWLALGADINVEAREGNTALTWAVIYGHTNVAKLLLSKGIHFNTNDVLNMVPRGHEDLADVLDRHGTVETGRRNRSDAIRCGLPREQHRYSPFDQ